ncbi:hypothetical protein HNQ07_000540 [Deinococcus metalli]|uniref:Uncharacterized protein n=1 Tax=Deinococcus metalli TaxID=1141878 RepID=A0A7W8NMV5_9DEIO|nr:hypothetical protein [Deinococcus metalli]MBB5375096.1 hypothetical protein [Deinococcus metalli]GHF31590.1 hypothetical protein GCM10017781_05020 [Deinococcus metalli]
MTKLTTTALIALALLTAGTASAAPGLMLSDRAGFLVSDRAGLLVSDRSGSVTVTGLMLSD